MAARFLNEDPWWENSDLTGPAREEPGAAMNITLSTDGPHSGDYSREVAEAMAEAARVLCHASIGSAPGLEYASDADSVTGSMASTASRLGQLAGQLSGFLELMQRQGRLGDDAGEDVNARVSHAREAYSAAERLAARLAHALADGHLAHADGGARCLTPGPRSASPAGTAASSWCC